VEQYILLSFCFSGLYASNIYYTNIEGNSIELASPFKSDLGIIHPYIIISNDQYLSNTKQNENIRLYVDDWTGVCKDGHRFNFYAPTRDIAQEYVNSYCKLRRDYQIKDIEAGKR
jgi:hypothetical protein